LFKDPVAVRLASAVPWLALLELPFAVAVVGVVSFFSKE
jgi:hypothetical protein